LQYEIAGGRVLQTTVFGSALVVALVTALSPIAVQVAEAQATSPVPAAPQAASRAPLPNRLNAVLPAWLRVRGEYRARMEGVDNAGFTDGRDDLFWLGRFRLNTTVTPARWLSGQVQVQDARVAEKEIGAVGAPFRASFDVRTAFADLGAPTAHVRARVGRQELAFGEQRLVGHLGWANAARAFDAGRATIRGRRATVDVFAASVVRTLPGEWDRSGNGNRFAGAYGTTTALVPKATVEPYVFYRSDRGIRSEAGTLAEIHQTTAGLRWVGQLPGGTEYGFEGVRQSGSLATDTISAWATHLQARTAPFASVRFTGEYNYATGDTDAGDGVRGTFDQLYPTPHDKYGLADQVGWRNIHHLRAGAEIARFKALPVSVNYHTWWLAEATDALYLASGAQLARVAGGASATHVGHELDIQVSRALTPQLQLVAGYAYIRSGAFLEEATPGASYSTPFLMLTYVFFAER
jgi:hypothetical protein